MKLLKKRVLIIFAVPPLVLGIVALVFFVMKDSAEAPKNMRQVKSFNAKGICQSINDPECGYCPNALINGKCFVKKGDLEQYQ